MTHLREADTLEGARGRTTTAESVAFLGVSGGSSFGAGPLFVAESSVGIAHLCARTMVWNFWQVSSLEAREEEKSL